MKLKPQKVEILLPTDPIAKQASEIFEAKKQRASEPTEEESEQIEFGKVVRIEKSSPYTSPFFGTDPHEFFANMRRDFKRMDEEDAERANQNELLEQRRKHQVRIPTLCVCILNLINLLLLWKYAVAQYSLPGTMVASVLVGLYINKVAKQMITKRLTLEALKERFHQSMAVWMLLSITFFFLIKHWFSWLGSAQVLLIYGFLEIGIIYIFARYGPSFFKLKDSTISSKRSS